MSRCFLADTVDSVGHLSQDGCSPTSIQKRHREMHDLPAKNPTEQPAEQRLKVDYIKSNFFRVIHADGLFGGLTPRGNIQMEIWSERQPIPRQSSYRVIVEGDGSPVLGDEVMDERQSREAFIREVEVGIVIDLELAKSMIDWLKTRVAALEEARAIQITSTNSAEG